ncbi:hypothetical protein [Spiroplasma endosymbiont of Labia minor]|uniref:hypothetical protein n=1 Tax=Spiroplasma endosymbiont of Labia minor TaxID=3066305 RepID=UPI0030D256B9
MGWKKEYKKLLKEETKKRLYSYDATNKINYLIDWQIEPGTYGQYNSVELQKRIRWFINELQKSKSVQIIPSDLKNDFSWYFTKVKIKEDFTNFPAVSIFQNVFNILEQKISDIAALLICFACMKFMYLTTIKFNEIINQLFKEEEINNSSLVKRVFETMSRTSLEAYEDIIYEGELISKSRQLNPNKNHLTVSEIAEMGQDFSYHWSRMLEQVCELTVESLNYQKNYQHTHTDEFTETISKDFNNFKNDYFGFNSEENNFEDFFEQTKTMVLSSELDSALKFFNLKRTDSYVIFKKAYRLMAKTYHPDVNSDADANQIMRKANIYKYVLEDHFKNV